MARSLEQILADGRGKHFDERARNVSGSYRFDVSGVGSYRLEVDHGQISFREDAGPADCVLALDPEDFVRIIEGEQNMLTAYMQGRIRIEGDLALANAFRGAIGLPRQPEGAHP
jgi:putative sterol carrier protein